MRLFVFLFYLSVVFAEDPSGNYTDLFERIKDTVVSAEDEANWESLAAKLYQQEVNRLYFEPPDDSTFERSKVLYRSWSGLKKTEYRAKLSQIAFYLRLYKLYNVDPRNGESEFYLRFPESYRDLDENVTASCNLNFEVCVDSIISKITETPWFSASFFDQPNTTTPDQDDYINMESVGANFKFQTSVSYYLCWFTQKRFELFKELAYCLSSYERNYFELKRHQAYNKRFEPSKAWRDYTLDGVDPSPYRCAQFSFCPDPCCSLMFDKNPNLTYIRDDRKEHMQKRCKQERLTGHGCVAGCDLPAKRNRDFLGILENRWNMSCTCGREGFEYSSEWDMCVDRDECDAAVHRQRYICPGQGQVCVNTVGSYLCACGLGYRPSLTDPSTCEKLDWPPLVWNGPAVLAPKEASQNSVIFGAAIFCVILLLA